YTRRDNKLLINKDIIARSRLRRYTSLPPVASGRDALKPPQTVCSREEEKSAATWALTHRHTVSQIDRETSELEPRPPLATLRFRRAQCFQVRGFVLAWRPD